MEKYNFYKTKYVQELLIDLIRLETLENYIVHDKSHVLPYYDITFITDSSGQFFLDNNNIGIKHNGIFFTSLMQVLC